MIDRDLQKAKLTGATASKVGNDLLREYRLWLRHHQTVCNVTQNGNRNEKR
jgi:hypothetical protein